ncbi:DUF6883 domain-containing protein [Candidatus Viridilinea mediisalina]|uniref:DUF6883 domain-containing protein n=1 Tax=Candidatus Viridilinea mediisalina TaxID=2024553 RepID=A0A2A6RDT5_9CHLR|nr:hypothetical protein CJ255_21165 [Candidatus Viridilinea mediisalina]
MPLLWVRRWLPAHHRGGSKATLLLQFGYAPTEWQRLAGDLRRDHLTRTIDLMRTTPYGMRYEIRAALQTPSGRPLVMRSIWQIDSESTSPRLITLYPD